jgi:hypothetical protein
MKLTVFMNKLSMRSFGLLLQQYLLFDDRCLRPHNEHKPALYVWSAYCNKQQLHPNKGIERRFATMNAYSSFAMDMRPLLVLSGRIIIPSSLAD